MIMLLDILYYTKYLIQWMCRTCEKNRPMRMLCIDLANWSIATVQLVW